MRTGNIGGIQGGRRPETVWKETEQTRQLYITGGAVCGDGGKETKIRRRIQVGASAWRKVEVVMGDRHIFRKLKGKVLNSCITPACLHGLETMAMTENNKKDGKFV